MIKLSVLAATVSFSCHSLYVLAKTEAGAFLWFSAKVALHLIETPVRDREGVAGIYFFSPCVYQRVQAALFHSNISSCFGVHGTLNTDTAHSC